MTMAAEGYGDLWAFRLTFAVILLVGLVGGILILMLR